MTSLTRRELLRALLGGALAASACRRGARSYPGEISGARVELGHRLLDATVERVSGTPERVPVVIVGAGPSGLVAAWELERQGERDYRVFELEAVPGGTSAWSNAGVVPHPLGAHYIPVPRREHADLVALLEELGAVERTEAGEVVGAEGVLVRAPEERLFVDGSWHEGLFPLSRATDADRRELARFEELVARYVAFRDAKGRRAFTLPSRECSDAAELVALDRISAARFLDEQGFRSKLLRWYVEYGCRDDYGASLERTSAWAMLFYFAARVPAPGRPSAGFLTWPEGNGRIVRHLCRRIGPRLRLSQLVTDVVPGEQGVELVVYDATLRRATRYLAEDVILAVPKLVARRIVRPLRQGASYLDEFRYGAWLVANIHLRDRPRSRGFPCAWDNVLFDSPGLGYVVASHQQSSDLGPTIWTYYRPFSDLDERTARRVLYELDHSTAVQAIVADLSRAHVDLESCIERIDVHRWGHAMVTPEPGFFWGAARKKAAQAIGRLVFAHSDLSGIPLFEEAFDRGVIAARRVVERRRSGLGT